MTQSANFFLDNKKVGIIIVSERKNEQGEK